MECRLYIEAEPADGQYGPNESVDLGRNWDVINFLLIGQRDSDGTPASLLSEEWPDIGGSEACAVDAESVAAFAGLLDGHTDEDLLGRYDPAALVAAEVYRSHVVRDVPDAVRAEINDQLPALRAFANECRKRRSGAVRVIC